MDHEQDRIYLIDKDGNIVHSILLSTSYTLSKFVRWIKLGRSSLKLQKDIILDYEGIVNNSYIDIDLECYEFSHTMKNATKIEGYLQHFFVKVDSNGQH